MIAWRNKTVKEYNTFIRQVFGFTNTYEVGETLLTGENYSLQDLRESIDPILVPSELEFKVVNVKEGEVEVPIGTGGEVESIAVYFIDVEEPFRWRLQVPQEPSHLDFLMTRLADKAKSLARIEASKPKSALASMKVAVVGKTGRTSHLLPSAIAWRAFWSWRTQFHSVRYPYALTAHRSQGSTFDHVMVDQRDILYNRNAEEALRCLYVADTRARLSSFVRYC